MTSPSGPETPRRQSRWPWIALVALLAAAGGGYVLYGDRFDALSARATPEPATPPEPPKPIAVTVVAAEMRDLTDALLVSGSLVARQEILVGPEIGELRIVELLAEEGDRVEKGALLARLDRSALEIQLAQSELSIAKAAAAIAQARAAITEAEASEVEAKGAFERTKALRASGTATIEQLMTREAQARMATARVASAREQLRLAEADKALMEAQRRDWLLKLSRTEIRAPEGGVVSARTAKIGAVVSMAGEPLFRIIRDGAIELAAEVPEIGLHRVADGQRARVAPAGRAEPIEGRVRLVSARVDPLSRLGTVWIALPVDAGLKPGLFARGTIVLDERRGVTVPQSAVLFGADGAYVQTVDAEGRIASRAVRTGIKADGRVEILGALAPGERVVARAGGFLRDGDRITPVEAPTQTAGGAP